MKIKSFLFILVVSVLFVVPVLAIEIDAGLLGGAAKTAGYSTNTSDTTFAETIGSVVKGALSMVGVIFLILMVYAGFLWMTARGEEEQVKKSQKIIISSIIGMVIVVSSYSVTDFIVGAVLSRTVK